MIERFFFNDKRGLDDCAITCFVLGSDYDALREKDSAALRMIKARGQTTMGDAQVLYEVERILEQGVRYDGSSDTHP